MSLEEKLPSGRGSSYDYDHPASQAAASQAASAAGAGAAPTAPTAPNAPGAVAGFGDAVSYGSPGPATDVHEVAVAPTPTDRGYWVATSDGRVLAYGDAAYHGSLAGQHLKSTIVGMAATPSGHGYWLVAADGGVSAFGDAVYHGSLVGVGQPTQSVSALTPTPSGKGYWVIASNGAIFSFGDATYRGAVTTPPASTVVTGLTATSDGAG